MGGPLTGSGTSMVSPRKVERRTAAQRALQDELRQRRGERTELLRPESRFSDAAALWMAKITKRREDSTTDTYRQWLDALVLPHLGGLQLHKCERSTSACPRRPRCVRPCPRTGRYESLRRLSNQVLFQKPRSLAKVADSKFSSDTSERRTRREDSCAQLAPSSAARSAENDEEWLRSEFEGTGIRAFWKGLSHLEGWASKYRDVVDCYTLDGKERVNDLVNKALGLAEFRKSQGGEAGLSLSSMRLG